MRYIQNSQITHVTAFYGVLNVNTQEFTYCRAGHPSIILQRDDNEIVELEANGSFLGMFNDIEFEENTVQLVKGDPAVFLYRWHYGSQRPRWRLIWQSPSG